METEERFVDIVNVFNYIVIPDSLVELHPHPATEFDLEVEI